MKEIKVVYLAGPAECNDKNVPIYSDEFLSQISTESGMNVAIAPWEEVKKQSLPIFFIASGGAEPSFEKIYEDINGPYILLTTPSYNSLAASMEIMGFLDEKGLQGEIIHGSIKLISDRLKKMITVAEAIEKLSNSRLGCFGEPGGLIASDVDFELLKAKTGITMEMFSLDELIDEYNRGGYEDNEYTLELKNKGYNSAEIEKALNVYGALCRLIKKYNLNGVTVKCFDLLGAIGTTGCLALAILNASGIPASCEGDQKALLSMEILGSLTGQSGFMANPSYMDPETAEIIFAHCTLPLNMPDSYELTTHFESGIGVAITSDIAAQTMTVFKTNGKMDKYYAGRAQLVETMHKKDLCRSQMRLKTEDGTEYFAKNPISNHHMIVKGDYKELIDEFFALINKMNPGRQG